MLEMYDELEKSIPKSKCGKVLGKKYTKKVEKK